MATKSAVSFVRQQLKVQGPSEHSGRGYYTLFSNTPISFAEVSAKLDKLLDKWKGKGLVQSAALEWGGGETYITVVLDPATFGATYNKVEFGTNSTGRQERVWATDERATVVARIYMGG
jgi:hypothetical protein